MKAEEDISKAIEDECNRFANNILKLVEKGINRALSSAKGARIMARIAAEVPPIPAHGVKRPPDDIAKLTDALYVFILENPGLRVEAIGEKMGRETNELRLPIKRLLAQKRIKTTGSKRVTRYWSSKYRYSASDLGY